MVRHSLAFALGVIAAATAAPAAAEVVTKTDSGFVIRASAEVDASPSETWRALTAPSGWWDREHTWSGDAANLSLDPRAGGCFCEVLPATSSPRAAPRGSVEHMRVVYAEEARALRMIGGLGPLQSEAVNAVLTVTLKPVEGGGTRIGWEYVVGGFMRYKVEEIAPAVDRVMTGQVTWLALKLGPRSAATPVAPAPAPITPAKPAARTAPGKKPAAKPAPELAPAPPPPTPGLEPGR